MFALCSVRFNTIFHLDYRPDLFADPIERATVRAGCVTSGGRREKGGGRVGNATRYRTVGRRSVRYVSEKRLNPDDFTPHKRIPFLFRSPHGDPCDLDPKWQNIRNIGLRFRNSRKYCQIFLTPPGPRERFSKRSSVALWRIPGIPNIGIDISFRQSVAEFSYAKANVITK